MAFISTVDERYAGGVVSYSAGALDASNLLNFDAVIAESSYLNSKIAYGASVDDYLTADIDIYSLGVLDTGFYTIDVDDWTWDWGNYDSSSIASFEVLDGNGYSIGIQYSSYLNINLTITSSQTYYVKVTGPSYGEAQYSIEYTKTGELINYPATYALYVDGSAVVGETLSIAGTYFDSNGVPSADNLTSLVYWYRIKDGVDTRITGEAGSDYIVTSDDIGYYIGYLYGFIDSHGFSEATTSVISTAGLVQSNINSAPTVSSEIADASANEYILYSYDTSVNFSDADAGDILTYSAVVDNGDGATSNLPSWLSIDSATGVISGKPANDAVGSLDIKVSAKDQDDASVSDTYTLTINDTTYKPVVIIIDNFSYRALEFNDTTLYNYDVNQSDIWQVSTTGEDVDVAHGDWSLYAFSEQLDSGVETILIDVDSVDGLYLSEQMDSVFNNIEEVIVDWLVENNTDTIIYIPSVLSASFSGGSVPNSALQTLINSNAVIVQSVANVSEGTGISTAWGDSYSDIINVAAYNVDLNGDSLHGNPKNSDVIDIYANGYITHLDWGWSFGTSFATPRVAAELTNTFVELFDYINNSLTTGEITQEDLESSGEVDYSDYVNSLLNLMTTYVYVEIDNTWYSDAIPVLSDDVATSALPTEVPLDAGAASIYSITDASYSLLGNESHTDDDGVVWYLSKDFDNDGSYTEIYVNQIDNRVAKYQYTANDALEIKIYLNSEAGYEFSNVYNYINDTQVKIYEYSDNSGYVYRSTVKTLQESLTSKNSILDNGNAIHYDVVKTKGNDTLTHLETITSTTGVRVINDANSIYNGLLTGEWGYDSNHNKINEHYYFYETHNNVAVKWESTTGTNSDAKEIDVFTSENGMVKTKLVENNDLDGLTITRIHTHTSDSVEYGLSKYQPEFTHTKISKESAGGILVEKIYIREAVTGQEAKQINTYESDGETYTAVYTEIRSDGTLNAKVLKDTSGNKIVTKYENNGVTVKEVVEITYVDSNNIHSTRVFKDVAGNVTMNTTVTVSDGVDEHGDATSIYTEIVNETGLIRFHDTAIEGVNFWGIDQLSHDHKYYKDESNNKIFITERAGDNGNLATYSNNFGYIDSVGTDILSKAVSTGGDYWDPQVHYDAPNNTFVFDIFESGISAERPNGGGFGTVGVFRATNDDFDGFSFEITGGEDASSFYISDQNSPSFTINSTGISSDYEVPVDAGNDHQFDLTIKATKGGVVENYNIVIHIIDVNEVMGDDSNNDITGIDGVDLITTGLGDDLVNAGGGYDLIIADGGSNNLNGDSGNDSIFLKTSGVWSSSYIAKNVDTSNSIGTAQAISLDGLSRFSDVIDGGADMDTLNLTAGNDAFFIDDVYSAHHSSLTLSSTTQGIDSIARVVNLEVINAGAGNDIVDLTSVNFILTNAVEINGEAGNDILWGSNGNDTVNGGEGDDTIFGGSGNDTLTGNSGSDIFQFTATAANDIITDFSLTDDSIQLYYRAEDNHTNTNLSFASGVLTWDVDSISNDIVVIDLSVATTSSNFSDIDQLITFVEIV